MSRKYKIRLYRVQDFDLYTIYYAKNFDFGKACREVILAYAGSQPSPKYSLIGVDSLAPGHPMNTAIVISIEDDEKAAIDMLGRLSYKNRNNFIKALLRRSLTDIEALYFEPSYRDSYPDPYSAEPDEVPLPTEASDVFDKPAEQRAGGYGADTEEHAPHTQRTQDQNRYQSQNRQGEPRRQDQRQEPRNRQDNRQRNDQNRDRNPREQQERRGNGGRATNPTGPVPQKTPDPGDLLSNMIENFEV